MLGYLDNLTIIKSKDKDKHSVVMDGDLEVIMAIYGHHGEDKAESVSHFVTHSAAVARQLQSLLEEIEAKQPFDIAFVNLLLTFVSHVLNFCDGSFRFLRRTGYRVRINFNGSFHMHHVQQKQKTKQKSHVVICWRYSCISSIVMSQ